jgi:predicted O-methyltransferase YrrM
MLTPEPLPPASLPRRALRRARRYWQRVRPFPQPRYIRPTPRIGGDHPWNPFLPPTAATLGAAALSDEAAEYVTAHFDRITPSAHNDASAYRYRMAQAKYGPYWRFADILRTLWGACTLLQPKSYLEIGVWRGRSAALVASLCPACDIYGFDLWIPDYAGAENPGPEFVRGELESVGHTGKVDLISGDSKQTVPAYLAQHPDLFFDIISFDGDKSIAGAGSDYAHALPRLKVGGIALTDDLPGNPHLWRIWNKLIKRDQRYVSWEFIDAGFGVAAAIRAFE